MSGQSSEIVLAEDDAEDAELELLALRGAGLSERTVWLKDGAEVLEFVRGTDRYAARRGSPHPKVVFLDLKMPKVSGLEVLASLKSDIATRCIPVVVLTSSLAERDIAESYRRGANSYVVKPVQFERLTEAVGAAARYWTTYNLSRVKGD